MTRPRPFAILRAAVFALSRPAMMAKNLHDAIGVVFLAAAMVGVRRDDDDTEEKDEPTAGEGPATAATGSGVDPGCREFR